MLITSRSLQANGSKQFYMHDTPTKITAEHLKDKIQVNIKFLAI